MKKIFIFSMLILIAGASYGEDKGWNIAFTSSGEFAEMNYGSSGTQHLVDTGKKVVTEVPSSFVDTLNVPEIKWVDGNSDGVIQIAEIMNKSQLEVDTAVTLALRESSKVELNRQHMRAFVEILIDEINALRGQHGLQPRTIQQFKNALNNKIDSGDLD